ncbi:uncharacterized protein LOC113523504 [Galleria mellonella]|uniref:Uncharacterized protein LOC113523504 n=1 Tax=Galleria mellonella TaxID=7137 RepID=A0A6J3BTU4_GALME|nr:uncharacterized protein LOC113523504 [Galleria mellonella]
MEKDIICTLNHGERVTSTYAEIYLNDSYCDSQKHIPESKVETSNDHRKKGKEKNEWQSPSDLLIGILELQPPFTSKITRGKTHQGILSIGDGVLETEHARFLKELHSLLRNNDAAWTNILDIEKKSVEKKVKHIYDEIFNSKSKIMLKEIAKFYESTLLELEDHMRSEIQNVLSSVHANIISDANVKIKSKLKQERRNLENILKQKYTYEIHKIKKYYEHLLNNELHQNNKLINQARFVRNDTLKAYVRQIEAENITNTMYVMCTERKKCKIKQFILDNYQMNEISEKVQKIKERQDIIETSKENQVHISEIHKEWEEKIKKVLQLFLKFISFSLKLLPEQSTFLLDLEKMVILQLNEIQKFPETSCSILVEEEKFENIFKYLDPETKESPCNKEPYILIGDTSNLPDPQYGSRETLPSEVDLPFIRLQRQFVYAKCYKYEEIKAFLESEQCKCLKKESELLSNTSQIHHVCNNIPGDNVALSIKTFEPVPLSEQATESSNESVIVGDYDRLRDCPMRHCKNWVNSTSFPSLNSYLDYTEENFERLKVILCPPLKEDLAPEMIDPKDIVGRELPFANELYHNAATQYSSQESINITNFDCTCTEGTSGQISQHHKIKESPSESLNGILMKRKESLIRLLQENPKLLKIFTDECFDFQL